MKKTEPPVVVEETFDAPATAVWSAITDVGEMRQWYFNNIPAFEARVGFETLFVVENEGRVFPHRWKVTKVVPGKLISYNWTFDNWDGEGETEFELTESDGATRLRLANYVLEDFPDDVPEFKRESCQGGWEYFIQGALKAYLEKA